MMTLNATIDSLGNLQQADKAILHALTESSGLPVDQLLGQNFHRVFVGQDWHIVRQYFEHALRGQRSAGFISLNFKDKPCEIRAQCMPIQTGSGVVAASLTLTDLSELRMVQGELAALKSRYDVFVNGAKESMHVIDISTGQYVDMNNAGLEMLGIRRDQISGISMMDISEPIQDDGLPAPESFQRRFLELQENRGYHEGVWYVRDQVTGQKRIHEYRATLLPDSNQLRITELDITDRVQAEQALKDSEGRYRMMTENRFEAIVILDPATLKFVDGNKLSCELYGVSSEELVQLGPLDVSGPTQPPQDLPAEQVAQKHIEAVFRHGHTSFEWVHRNRRTEETILCEVRLEIVPDTEPVKVRGSVVNITEKKAIAAQLQQSEKMRAIGQLAGGIAHDLNNILGVVVGSAELVKLDTRSKLSMAAVQRLDAIIKTGNRAADLTSKMAAFGRAEVLECVPFSLHALLDNTFTILRQSVDRKITMSLELVASNDTVAGSAAASESMLFNVLINAIQALPAGQGSVIVRSRNVRFYSDTVIAGIFEIEKGEYIEIEIADTGTGIDHESLEKIFEPYFTTKNNTGGIGLGLAAVFGTVQDHRGAVQVESTPGVGTIVRILLPCSPGPVMQSADRTGDNQPMSKLILVVEDEIELRDILGSMLSKLGNMVIFAENGVEAIEKFKQQNQEIDAVFMDINMPLLGGWDAIDRISKIRKDCPIVVTSGFNNEAFEDYENVVGFMKKPFLLHNVREILERMR